MDCNPPGFSVHEILQARILEWVVMPFSRGSFWPRDRTGVSSIARRFFTGDKHRQCIKKQRHYFADKGLYSQSYGFSSNHVWMWELDHKEDWVPKNWCFWTVLLEETLESPLHCKEIKSVNPKGNQSCTFTGRTDAETEAPVFWPPEMKRWLIRKDPDAGKDWR